MGIYVKEMKEGYGTDRSFAIYDSFNCEFLTYEGVCLRGDRGKKEIKEYRKEHPYPKKETSYSFKDMLNDMTRAGGSITMICKLEETADWVADMIRELI